MMRNDHDTHQRLHALILAEQRDDHDETGRLLGELVDGEHDAVILAMLLARQAAHLPHVVHHIADADISPQLSPCDLPGKVAAVRIAAAEANDDADGAFALILAQIAIGEDHAKQVIRELLHIAAKGTSVVILSRDTHRASLADMFGKN